MAEAFKLVSLNVNIYAPNKDKDLINFFKNLFAILQKENLESEENIIIGGDFNRPFYSCWQSDLASDWQRGWS